MATTIGMSEIKLTGTDAQGRFAMAERDGEMVGVSLAGEDEAIRDLDEITIGARVEVGNEIAVVVDDRTKRVALEVSARRNDFRADEIRAVIDADPTLSADEVIETLDEAAAEHAENVAAEARDYDRDRKIGKAE